jgi:hypothetical protein
VRIAGAQVVAWGVLLAAAAWLLSPALHPVHVEGFSASTVALGMHLADGTLPDFFPSQPFTTEYFGLTKLGAVLGVAGLVKLGFAGDTAMRVLMALGTLLLFGATARLVRHWSGAPWLVIAAVLLLMPGIAETGFFFNDNMLGTGLLVTALALFCDRPGITRSLAAGVLIGMAVAVRTDLVLVTPALLLMALERTRLPRAALLTAVAGIAALASLWLIYASVGASPLDAVRAGKTAVELWDRPGDLERQFQSLLLFLGLPAMILYLLGLRAGLAAHEWRRLVLLLGIPLFVNLALAGRMWEVRQLLPLTPFLAAVAVRGVQDMVTDWRLGRRVAPAAIGLAMAAILLAPPAAIYQSDGPRAVFGRIGAISGWHAWQARIRRNFVLIDGIISSAPRAGTLAVVVDYWDEDRYLHLRLLELGYNPNAQPRACDGIGQSMGRDRRIILQLSPHHSFLPNAEALFEPRLLGLALPCLRAVRTSVILIASADRVARVLGAARPPSRHLSDTPLAATTLSPVLLARLSNDHKVQSRLAPRGKFEILAEATQETLSRTGFGSKPQRDVGHRRYGRISRSARDDASPATSQQRVNARR